MMLMKHEKTIELLWNIPITTPEPTMDTSDSNYETNCMVDRQCII